MSYPSEVLVNARAEALFTSLLATGTQPSRREVATAVANAVRVRRGVRGCAAQMAAAYGERPEAAARRMRWARRVILALYGDADGRLL